MHDSLSLGDHAAGLTRPVLSELAVEVGGLGLEGWRTAGRRPERKGTRTRGEGWWANAFGRMGGGVGYGLGVGWARGWGTRGDPANDFTQTYTSIKRVVDFGREWWHQ